MNTAYRAAARLIHRAPIPDGKLARSLRGRREAPERWLAWASAARRPGPLLWLHTASVGEALAAEPICRRLRAVRPDLQIIHTFCSPSADGWPGLLETDHGDFLPLEDRTVMEAVLDSVKPSVVVFSRGDLWPTLVLGASARGIATAVVGGVVRPGSWRLRWPARHTLAPMHRRLAYVGAVTPGDASRWRRLGVAATVVDVTGDPRDDQVLERVPLLSGLHALAAWAVAGPVLVAGSTHRADEAPLVSAFARVRASHPAARLLVVPHEPGPRTLRRLTTLASRDRVPVCVWPEGGPPPPSTPLILAALTGRLADLYALGTLAYVGGGFDRRGLHAVAEPAAFALPLLLGPRAEGHEVGRMIDAGGAVPAPTQGAPQGLADQWRRWLDDEHKRWAAGLAARRSLDVGASDRTVNILNALIDAGAGG